MIRAAYVEKLAVEIDAVATAEENNNLLLLVLAEEREEQFKPDIRVADNVALFKTFDCYVLLLVVDVDIQWAGFQGDTCEVFDLGRLGCGEQHRLSVLWEDLGKISAEIRARSMNSVMAAIMEREEVAVP